MFSVGSGNQFSLIMGIGLAKSQSAGGVSEQPVLELSKLSKELGLKGSGTSYNQGRVSRGSHSQGI